MIMEIVIVGLFGVNVLTFLAVSFAHLIVFDALFSSVFYNTVNFHLISVTKNS